jgi:AraC family transcriptional regulator
LPDLANLDYLARVNRAIDHVHQHLADPLTLAEVARAAAFSPYHFHRIFRGITGETLHAFILRVRLERALYLRAHHPRTSFTDIALACGFASSSDFSRSFKRHYGVSPRSFDLDAYRRGHREAQTLVELPPGQNPDGFRARLRALPARHVAYLRVDRPGLATVRRAAERLATWADAHGLGGGQWLGYMWDEPENVAEERHRYDVGVELPKRVITDEVGVVSFAAMTVAEVRVAGPLDLETRAFDWLYGTWLPRSGYAPDHQPVFEAWVGKPFAHGDAHFELAVQLPVIDAGLPLPVPRG